MMQIVAGLALGIFAVGMLWIGLYSSRHSKTMDGFLLGGRKIGPWMSAFAYGTSYFSAVIFVGFAGKLGWDIGFAALWIGVGNAFLGSFLAWMVLAKRTRKMTHTLHASTMPEFFEARYQSRNMKIYAALIIFIFLVPYAATVYKGLGALFGSVFPNFTPFGISPTVVCMFIIAILTAFYLVIGGYSATVLTDFIQGIIMLVGVIVMAIFIAQNPQVGGVINGIGKLKEIDIGLVNIWGGDNLKFLLITILLTSFGTWGLPQMIHKYYSLKDEKSIKTATIVSTVFCLVIGCGAYFVGTFGRLYLNNQLPVGGYDEIIPTLLMIALSGSVATNIILSVILLLVLSASMSTLSAIVLTSSSALSVDLLAVVRPNFAKNHQMILMRTLCFLFIALSFFFAYFNISIIVSIMSFSWGVVSGCFIGPYIWGLYSKKITKAGAWCGLLTGFTLVIGSVIVTTFTGPTIAQGFKAATANAPLFGVVAMAVSVVIVPIVSLFTKKLPADHIEFTFNEIKS